jgi:hypothetical protein
MAAFNVHDMLWKMVTNDELLTQICKFADDYDRTVGECFTKQMAMKDRDKKESP